MSVLVKCSDLAIGWDVDSADDGPVRGLSDVLLARSFLLSQKLNRWELARADALATVANVSPVPDVSEPRLFEQLLQ